MLNKKLGCELNYEFKVGHDFPDNIEDYDLVIHCGACMVNRNTTRTEICVEKRLYNQLWSCDSLFKWEY